jgi:MFS family permease
MTLASFTIAFFVPRLSRRFGDAPFLAGGLATVMIGTYLLGNATASGNYALVLALPLMLIGLGQGAATIRLTSAGIANVSPADSGAASGIVSVAVQLGSSLGLSVLVAIASALSLQSGTAAAQSQQNLQSALHAGAGLVLLALACVVIWVLPKVRNK